MHISDCPRRTELRLLARLKIYFVWRCHVLGLSVPLNQTSRCVAAGDFGLAELQQIVYLSRIVSEGKGEYERTRHLPSRKRWPYATTNQEDGLDAGGDSGNNYACLLQILSICTRDQSPHTLRYVFRPKHPVARTRDTSTKTLSNVRPGRMIPTRNTPVTADARRR